jgi:hypothetical protein
MVNVTKHFYLLSDFLPTVIDERKPGNRQELGNKTEQRHPCDTKKS